MPKRTEEALRRKFFHDHLKGESYADIAAEEGFSKECVRYWCRRQKRGGSATSHYPGPPRGLLGHFDPLVRYVLLKLRLQHPGWGPTPLLHEMKKRPSLTHLSLPHPSQIGRYLHQFEKFRRPQRDIFDRERPNQPTHTSQRWEIDFKMGIPLPDGNQVNLFTTCDPFAGACIGAQVFPAGQVGQAPKKVTQDQVRIFLRGCFEHWGVLPEELQTDGESTLVANHGAADFPTSFTCWLEGLDIHHRVIRPHRPTDNAEVERMHQTVNEFALRGCRLTNLSELNAHLEETTHLLVYELPSQAKHCQGQIPIVAHPELDSPVHRFQPQWELSRFDLARVDAYLAQFKWERRVQSTGQVDIGSQVYSLGRPYARKLVTVRYDPAKRELIFSTQIEGTGKDGDEIKRLAIRGHDTADLIGFSTPDLAPCPQQLPLPIDWSFSKTGVNC